jgi:hypothetical protein
MNQFDKNVYCLKCNNFLTAVADADYLPASASFIDMSELEQVVFLIGVGTLDSATTFQVKQDTAATATGSIKVVTGLSQVVGANDDNHWLTITVRATDLDRANNFRFVTLLATGGAAADDFFCVFALGFGASQVPVTQPGDYAYAV